MSQMSHSARDTSALSQSARSLRRALSPASLSGEEHDSSREATGDGSAAAPGQYTSPQPAARKRRRIGRACDDCRRKKIKCDGGQPCASCADFSSKCTYATPSIREKIATKSKEYEALEQKLQRAEALLRRFMPGLDIESLTPEDPTPPRAAVANAGSGPTLAAASAPATEAEADTDRPSFIQLVERSSQLDITDTGESAFHGMSSGAAFLSRISQQFPTLVGYDARTPFLPQPHRPFLASPMGGLPVYSANPWWQENYDYSRLPPRDLAQALCNYSFSCASCILRVVHAPSFWKTFDTLYEERPEKYTDEQRRFVGLLFSIIALGSMYDVDENDPTNPDHYAVAMDRGHKFYISARLHLQDITECCDMTTLQALAFIIQFLQATGNLSGCHTMIGIALCSALRMGLHRHLPHTSMTPIRDETRRRVFHTIRQMDIYLATTLGLPLMLQDKDIDQPLPTEADDENITEVTILHNPTGTASFLQAFNAHAKLMRILATVVEHIYPPKGADGGPANVTYKINCARIREIEQDLHDWQQKLPPTWRPGPEEDLQITRVKTLLRFAYGHVQLMLYRPFLQFHARQPSNSNTTDERHLALAMTGINVCRNIIHIGSEIRRQAVLIGPYWFITYTQFFAVLSVILYVLHNPDKPEASELISDARLGRDTISGHSQRSQAADRVTAALNSLFDQLPGQFKSADHPPVRTGFGPASSDKNTHIRPRAEPAAQPPASLAALRPSPEQWGLHPSATSNNQQSRNYHNISQHQPMMHPVPMLTHPLGSEPTSVMGFHIEDPFAYPIMPGVSLSDNSFTALQDTMRLPVYNMHTDMEGQLLCLQDPMTVPGETALEDGLF